MTAVETPPPAPFARKWAEPEVYVPQVTGPVLVPARTALPLETPSTAALAKARLEGMGWVVRVTYAQGCLLETDTPVETVALRCFHQDGRRGWAIWTLSPDPPPEGKPRTGAAQGGWVKPLSPTWRKRAWWKGPLKATAWMDAMGWVAPPPKPKKGPCPTCGTKHTKKAGCPVDVPMEATPLVLEG